MVFGFLEIRIESVGWGRKSFWGFSFLFKGFLKWRKGLEVGGLGLRKFRGGLVRGGGVDLGYVG